MSSSSDSVWFQVLAYYILGLLTLIMGSICLGIILNQMRDKPLPLVYESKSKRLEKAVLKLATAEIANRDSAQTSSTETVTLQELRKFVDERQGLVLDARPEIFHQLGHVPGALSLPRDDFKAGYSKLRERLEKNRSVPIVVYCSGESCEDSQMVHDALVRLGYTKVAVFRGGWGEWENAGLTEEKTP